MVEKVAVGGDVEFGQELFVPGPDAEEVGYGGVKFGFELALASRGLARPGPRRSPRSGAVERIEGGGDGGGAVVGTELLVVEEAGEVGREAFR